MKINEIQSKTYQSKLGEAQKSLDGARRALVAYVDGEAFPQVRELASRSNAVAEAAGHVDFWANISRTFDYLLEHEGLTAAEIAVQEYIIGRLIQGPDDTWSGRGNDVQRAFFDGIRDAARRNHSGSSF